MVKNGKKLKVKRKNREKSKKPETGSWKDQYY